jgi:hypothetical protein
VAQPKIKLTPSLSLLLVWGRVEDSLPAFGWGLLRIELLEKAVN